LRPAVLKFSMRLLALMLVFVSMWLLNGCASSSRPMRLQMAELARENAALKRQIAALGQGVTVIGPVQNSFVPWVAGLTLTQAIATANYLNPKAPRWIAITRNGESAQLDAGVLLNGTPVPLEPGDVVELQP
jgi:hypothetical protein